ncbi:MAG: phosphoenolpyruvate--protein phosphotransferase [Chroococcidiopsidaceae cyanobacterium CP_BM_RX_35]|nr:phosphoenolpyruvate--protein phosphotransferase [Chroococcidiopsidaceae cyanobacterium CP_BM_RX_35]
MVGIVIVSHSKQLAEGVRELAAQMVQGKVPLAVAGGIEDPQNSLGTDVIQVHQAITSVYSDEGVVVLMDLGSALMSAEMALEFLPEDQRANVHLCEAPLVEGAIAAAVQAAAGSDIEQVITEARSALAAKAAQLGIVSSPLSVVSSNGQQTTGEEQKTKEIRLTIRNRLGLHARPAAQFVATAASFQSLIRVRNLTKNTEYVDALSINQVATLGVRQGHELAITAQGSDAGEALAALLALIEANFGEDDTALESQPAAQINATPQTQEGVPLRGELLGIPASPGVAIAPIVLYHPTPLKQERPLEDAQTEWRRLRVALQIAQQEIQTLQMQTATQIGKHEAAIFNAQLLSLEDPLLVNPARQAIVDDRLSAEDAWQAVVNKVVATYRTLEDPYMQERAVDMIDLGQRVLRQLAGVDPTPLNLPQPAILVAIDLTPSDTAQLDPTKVLGICTALGSATSHSAILARTLGIPAVVGVGLEVLNLPNDTLLALDGESGKVWLKPEPDTLAALQAKRDTWEAAQQQARELAHHPAFTRDGKRVTVLANIGGIADANVALNLGAEGVGLLRTEFLYLDRTTAPGEDEQLAVYQAIAQVMGTRPLIIRTLDVGGDKPLPYLGLQQEANSFLGCRGIRFCLDQPNIFKTQLRAILRASPGHQIKVMFPMIATVAEVQAAKAILAQAQAELRQASISFDEAMEVGIMVEVPAAVVIADQLAALVDFFSIGTNDLSQYIMACDRTNPRVAGLADALHPAVLRMVYQTVQAGHEAGIWVGLCGELACDPLAAPILLGLGLDELSLNPQAIPALKQAITQLTVAQSEAITLAGLKLDSAASVRAQLYPPQAG